MELELFHDNTRARVDTLGAWLTNLSDGDGDILFPKRALTTIDGTMKQRGGCHICLPNFGPGGVSGLVQHGYGREMEWSVDDKTDDSVLLRLPQGAGDYEDLSAVLTYQLGARRLLQTLEVTNEGSKTLRVAPGFHPYFMTKDGSVLLGNEPLELDHLNEAVFRAGDRWILELSGRRIILESTNLTTWALWTDQLAPYVCVEPTLAGFAFEQDQPTADELVSPGESKSYSVSFTW